MVRAVMDSATCSLRTMGYTHVLFFSLRLTAPAGLELISLTASPSPDRVVLEVSIAPAGVPRPGVTSPRMFLSVSQTS